MYLEDNLNNDLMNNKDIKEMCNKCECYCGKEHNYEECRNNNCFRFYLAYKYLLYLNTIEEIF